MLSIVPTPLGNLSDLTRRAEQALRAADIVYAEDTRRTRILLQHLGLGVPLARYNEHDPRSVRRAMADLRAGRKVALTSDGGTPVLSDPGVKLVAAARREGLPVDSLPGPFAAAAAVAGSGLPGDSFVFLGFLPRSPGRQKKALAASAALARTIVVYESPYRIVKLLGVVEETLGPDAQAVVVRELTKIHEEWVPGTVRGVRETLAGRDRIRGEIVLVLHPAPARAART